MQIDSLLVQRAPFLPSRRIGVLRGRVPITVNQAVFDAVVHDAAPRWRVVHKDDSTAKGAPAIKPGGAAPIPGSGH